MKKRSQRTLALILAILFFVSSVGYSVAIIYQLNNQDDISKNLQEQINQEVSQTEGNMLEGTKLEGFAPLDKVEELQVVDLVVGTGEEAKADSIVVAHYTGAIAKDGTIFQSSQDGDNQPFTSPLSNLIVGWQKGIPGMKAGGKRRLIIPAAMAYGESSPSASIPPNSDMVFDIELVAVQ